MTDRLISSTPNRSLHYQQGWKKTWVTVDAGTYVSGSANDTTVAPAMMYQFKRGLTSAPIGAWTVLASSGKAGGGSLVASTDDNWTSSADLVRGTSDSSARAWILLKSPNSPLGPYYFLLDYWHATSDSYCQMYFTKSQPNISSPSTTARPTVTGFEWSYANEPFHGISNTDLGGTRSYLFTAHDGSFAFFGTSGYAYTLAVSPYVRSGLVFNVLSKQSLAAWDTVGAASMHFGPLAVDSSIITTAWRWKTLHQDGSAVSLAQIQWAVNLSRNIMRYMHTPAFGPITDWPTLPIWLVCVDTSKKCIRGYLEDISFTSECTFDGQIFFRNEVPAAVKMGIWLVPTTCNLMI